MPRRLVIPDGTRWPSRCACCMAEGGTLVTLLNDDYAQLLEQEIASGAARPGRRPKLRGEG